MEMNTEMNTEMNMEVNIMEAKDVEDVRKFFRLKPYAKVSITGNPNSKKTKVDKHGKTNPAWYSVLDFAVPESAVQQDGLYLKIELYCERTAGDRFIGEVHESIKELYERASANGGSVVLTCPVKRGSAESQGELKFSCRFGDRRTTDDQQRSSVSGMAMDSTGSKILQYGSLLCTAGIQTANLVWN